MAMIVFNAFGSWGDLFPLLPIAAEARRRGHTVRFAVPDGFVEVVEAEGFEVAPVGGRAAIVDRIDSAHRYDVRPRNLLAVRRLWRDFVLDDLPATVEALGRACSDADVLVAHPAQQAAPIVHERTGIPWVTASMILGMMPSRHTLPQGAIQHPFKGRLGRAINASTWATGKQVLARILDPPTNAARKRAGEKRRRHTMLKAMSEQLTLWLSSPVYQPRPPDWPDHVRQVGFTYFDAPKAWPVPNDLEAFVEHDDPFVVFTLGFSAAMNPGSFFDLARKVRSEIGTRAAFLGGWARNIDPIRDVDHVAWTFAPLSRLLPRAAAIVHAGGYGSTCASLRYGVPQVVVPWGFDQLFHGDHVRSLGTGKTLPRRRLSADTLARLLIDVTNDDGLRSKARLVRADLEREGDGSRHAIDEIELLLRQS